jgi:hypothetical protein
MPANLAAQEVGRLPQTTISKPEGGPFIRYSEDSQQTGFSVTGQAWGALINQPLSAVGGWFTDILIKVQAVGGAGSAACVAAADAPFSALGTVSFRDSSGQAIVPSIDGYGLFLFNLYSGMLGSIGAQDPRNLPSWSALQTTSGTGCGNFTFKLWIPFSVNSATYCSLAGDNAAEVPKLSIQLGTTAAVYSTAPLTITTVTLTVEEGFASVPNNRPDLAPFDAGASSQILVTTSGINPPSAAAMRIPDAAVGQFVHTKIYVLRDSTNARIDAFPSSDLALWIDNYQYKFELNDDRYDKMTKAFGQDVTRPTGVIVHTWRKSIQSIVSEADDGENWLSTVGATKVEIGGTWGTISNQPAQLFCYTGMVFPGDSGFPYGSQGYTSPGAAA